MGGDPAVAVQTDGDAWAKPPPPSPPRRPTASLLRVGGTLRSSRSPPTNTDHAHLAPGGGHPSKVNNTFGGGCLDPQQFVHILWGGSTDPQQFVHILWGESTDPQQFVHILGGGWGREGHQLWCQLSHGTGHLAPLELPNFPQSAPRVCTHPLGWDLGPPRVCTHPWGWGGPLL